MRTKRMKRCSRVTCVLSLLATLLAPVQSAMATDVIWTARAPMPTASQGLTANEVGGKLYAIGGTATQANQEYNPATNTWNAKAPMPTGRYSAASAVVNGKIYVIGGYSSAIWFGDQVEEYDPAANTWTTKAPMPTRRQSLTAAVINDKIYAIGGNGTTGQLSTVEEYDPATNTWTTKAPMPTARFSLGSAVVDNKIYAFGGYGGGGAAEVYDPATNTWTTKASMPNPRYIQAALTVNGKIYVMGGSGVRFASGEWVNGRLVQEYDPAADSWQTVADRPTSRIGFAGAVIDGKMLVVGGVADSGGILNTSEEGLAVGVDQAPAQVGGTVDPAIELTLNPPTLQFGNVNPAVGNYTLTRTATVRSNRDWQLFVRKVNDLTGANTGSTIPSNRLTFTSPAQTNPVEFLLTDTLVGNGTPTAGNNLNIDYALTVAWTDPPDTYNAEQTFTAVQP